METTSRKEFTTIDTTINSKSPRAKYRRRAGEMKTAVHWGQRKLLMSEVQFFVKFWDPIKIPRPLCVYAGSAPGIHIPILSMMFPEITFHLYDPAKFEINETERIKIFNVYFTDEIAKEYSGRDDVFFISDIRTSDHKEHVRKALEKHGITKYDKSGNPIGDRALIKKATDEGEAAHERQIADDMKMQEDWFLIINPVEGLLKFRLSYAINGEEILSQYLSGYVFIQCWVGATSTESRLKPVRNEEGNYFRSTWSSLEYEEWFFYHNLITRETTKYINPLTGTEKPIDYPELLNDYDSTSEAFILKGYFERFNDNSGIPEKVIQLSRMITRHLNRGNQVKTMSWRREEALAISRAGPAGPFMTKRELPTKYQSPRYRPASPGKPSSPRRQSTNIKEGKQEKEETQRRQSTNIKEGKQEKEETPRKESVKIAPRSSKSTSRRD